MDGAQSIRINFGRPVAIFPLATVLLPQQPMPLHVFEPRYRQMVDSALDSSGQIAIATLDPKRPADAHGRPAVRPVICIGQIVTHERLPDGRFNLVLHGPNNRYINDDKIADYDDLYNTLDRHKPGDRVTVHVEASGQVQKVELALVEIP